MTVALAGGLSVGSEIMIWKWVTEIGVVYKNKLLDNKKKMHVHQMLVYQLASPGKQDGINVENICLPK